MYEVLKSSSQKIKKSKILNDLNLKRENILSFRAIEKKM